MAYPNQLQPQLYMDFADWENLHPDTTYMPIVPFPCNRRLLHRRNPQGVISPVARLNHANAYEQARDAIRRLYSVSPDELQNYEVPVNQAGAINWREVPDGWTVTTDANQNYQWEEQAFLHLNNHWYYTADRQPANAAGQVLKRTDPNVAAVSTGASSLHPTDQDFDLYVQTLRPTGVRNSVLFGIHLEIPIGTWEHLQEINFQYWTIQDIADRDVQDARQIIVGRLTNTALPTNWYTYILPLQAQIYFQPILNELEKLKMVLCTNDRPAHFRIGPHRWDEVVSDLIQTEIDRINAIPNHQWTEQVNRPHLIWGNQQSYHINYINMRTWLFGYRTMQALSIIWRQWEIQAVLNPQDGNNPAVNLGRQIGQPGVPVPPPGQPFNPQHVLPYGIHPAPIPYAFQQPIPYAHQAAPPVAHNQAQAAAAALRIKAEIKHDEVPEWDGQETEHSGLLEWIADIDSLAELVPSDALGSIVPARLTGSARHWWRNLPPQERRRLSQGWTQLREAVIQNWATSQWRHKKQRKGMESRYREPGYITESPQEYAVRKRLMLQIASPDITDVNVIFYIMEGAPRYWRDILPPDSLNYWPTFYQALDTYKEKLIQGTEADKMLRHIKKSQKVMKGITAALASFNIEDTVAANQSKASPFTRETPKTANRPYKSFYTGPPLDYIISKNGTPKSKGKAGCKICRSGNHYTNECPKYEEDKAKFKEWKRKQNNLTKPKAAVLATYDHEAICAALGESPYPEYSSSSEEEEDLTSSSSDESSESEN